MFQYGPWILRETAKTSKRYSGVLEEDGRKNNKSLPCGSDPSWDDPLGSAGRGRSKSLAARKICKVEEEEIVSVRTAQKWFKKFSEGHTDLRDEPRSGCPMTVNTEAIRAAVEANPSTSTRRLSAELDIPQTSVVRHLKAIGKVNRRCQEVPHDLTENQTQNRVDICRKLLRNPRDDCFIRRL